MKFKKGYTPWNKGKKMSEEFCLKLSNNNVKYWEGKKLSKEHIKKISDNNKGKTPWNKGLKCPEISEGQLLDNNPNWKGDKVSYSGIHKWLVRNFGRACGCAVCGGRRSNHFVWANVSGKYKRDKMDWVQLCGSCHLKFDRYKSLEEDELLKIEKLRGKFFNSIR